MKKKICFLTATVFSIGGIQRCVSKIANKLVEKGYDVQIVCTDRNIIEDYNLYNLNKKIKVYTIPANKLEILLFGWTKVIKMICKYFPFLLKHNSLISFLYYKKFFIRNKKLVDYINKNDFDVVIGAGGYQSILLALLKEKINCKIYGWQHSSCQSYFESPTSIYFNQIKLYKECMSKFEKYIVLTDADKNWLKENFDANSITIYNPKSFESNKVSNLKSKTFISVGRFAKVKGYDRLIKSFKLFNEKNNEWNLLIVGEGPLKDELQNQITECGLQNKIFLIPSTNNIVEYYLNSSIYLLSSYYEGLPMVLIEACECGIPIISYDLPCCVEQFGDCSIFVENGNVEEYADKMLSLVNDSSLLKKLSVSSKLNSKKYCINSIIEKWEKIL